MWDYDWEYCAKTTASEPQTCQNMMQSNAANQVDCGCALIFLVNSLLLVFHTEIIKYDIHDSDECVLLQVFLL